MAQAHVGGGAGGAEEEAGPLSELAIASRLRKNRGIHRALLLFRATLFIVYLAYRVSTLLQPLSSSCSSSREAARGELLESSCNFNGELGVVALACEMWFFMCFMMSIVMKWSMVERVAYPDKLLHRFQELPKVDVFVTTADPSKEPPLIAMNTILSILTFNYPTSKLACYLSDDGGSLLTLWSLKETISFAKSSWHPFCIKFSPYIQPGAPGPYLSRKENEENAIKHGFLCEWNVIKEQYKSFEYKITSMTVAYCQSKEATLQIILKDMTISSTFNFNQAAYLSWASNYDPYNHPSHCEVLLEKPQHSSNAELPYLVYLSREKRVHQKHHSKAGAMNCLLRVSGIMTNAPFVLNLDCDMYVNETKALLQAMCFFMENKKNKANDKLGFVQFPQTFEGVDKDDIYGSSMSAALEVCLKGMDGVQGPFYCGTGCVHKRESLYGKSMYGDASLSKLENFNGQKIKDTFGLSPNLVLSAQDILSCTNHSTISMSKETLVKDAIALMASDFEDNTSWGKEVGWMYGSVTEDLLTSMKIHGRGWRSVVCMPHPPAFVGCAPSTSEDALTTWKRWSMGMLEMLLSSNSPLLPKALPGLGRAQRLIYIYICGAYTLTCFPFFTYLLLPSLSISIERPLFPKVVEPAILMSLSLIMSVYMISIYENRMVGVPMKQWWNGERMDSILTVSSYLFASCDVLKKKVLGLSETTFVVTPKGKNGRSIAQNNHDIEGNEKTQEQSEEIFVVNSTLPIFIAPTIVVIFNIGALIVSLFYTIRSHSLLKSWLSIEATCCLWILFVFYPFTKGFLLWIVGHRNGPSVLSTSSVLWASFIVGALSLLTTYL